MATSHRAELISKAHKILKKHYKPITSTNERTVLENMLYACCLQNAKYDVADTAFTKIQDSFFDWNEVRVTTIAELSELMSGLPDPIGSATQFKRTLQSVFEERYSFDIEDLRKQNIGATVKQLAKSRVSPFAISYVTQHSLSGHSIPIDQGAMDVMFIIGAIDENERKKEVVPGMERAIPKKKGIEFASLLHQLAADLVATPHSPEVRAILKEIQPDCQSRLPKRATRKTAKKETTKRKAKKSTKKPTKATAKKKSAKKVSSSGSKKIPAKKKTSQRGRAKSKTAKKSATKQLAKRKPR